MNSESYTSWNPDRDKLIAVLVGLSVLKKLDIVPMKVYEDAYTAISSQYFFKTGIFYDSGVAFNA